MEYDRLVPILTPPTPDPDVAEAQGTVLWAMELDYERRPVRAHRITAFERDAQGGIIAAATECGERYREGSVGCWSTRAGDLPLDEASVCCGMTAGRRPGRPRKDRDVA